MRTSQTDPTAEQRSIPDWSGRDWVLLAALTILGGGLRFYRLGETPPGFQFDEAFNAIDAAQVLHGNFPLFLPANGGREVLYTYFQAALGALMGVNVYTLRLASALLGIATAPATYLLIRLIVRRHSRSLAVFTALTLAVSVWHLHFSHYGIRVITMPLLLSVLFGCYWIGLFGPTRQRRLLATVASGVLIGLGVWTNPTGRLVPFVLILFTAWLVWRHTSGPLRERRYALDGPLGALALAGAVALAVFLPLGLEFYRHPEWFTGHAAEVSIFADRVSQGRPWQTLLANIGRVLGMFSIAGDQEWIHGPAGRPVFDPLMSIPFVLGAGIWGWRLWRRRQDDPDLDALALLAFWSLVMLATSALSDAAPNFSRTLPSLPALFVAAGLGLDWIASWRRATPVTAPGAARAWPIARPGLLAAAAIVTVSGVIAFYDYFVRFPQQPEVYIAYEANKLETLRLLNAQADQYEIYLQPLWADHPPVRFFRSSELVKALDTADAFVLPPVGKGVIYAYPPEMADEAARVAAIWPGARIESPLDPYGAPLYVQVKVEAGEVATWPPAYTPAEPIEAHFSDAPTLLGMQQGPRPGELMLFWRGEERETIRDLTTFVHLIDTNGRKVAQIDKLPGNGSYLTTGWAPGERVIEAYTPIVSDPCAGGDTVQVWVGWYELGADGARRPRSDTFGDMAMAGHITLPIVGHRADDLTIPNTVEQALNHALTLVGHQIHTVTLEPGAPVVLDLYLRGEDAVADTMLTLLLDDEAGGAASKEPLWRALVAPGVVWPQGEIICRRARARLAPDLPAGVYQLVLAGPTDHAPVTAITVAPSTRQFAPPPGLTPVEASFDHAIELVSYAVAPASTPDEGLEVTLAWRAMREPAASYTVFVHLLDATGAIVAQSDALPAGGYPTDHWLAGEVVVDSHWLPRPVDAPPGPFWLVAGLYDAGLGVRLPAFDDQGVPLANDAIVLGELTLP